MTKSPRFCEAADELVVLGGRSPLCAGFQPPDQTSQGAKHPLKLVVGGFQPPDHVPEKTFIATAGFMSLTIFGFINHKNIVGVIDQNKLLHNKHFGCTNLTIQPYEYLKGFSSEYSILVHGYRTPDIINCIRKINTDIQIIIFPEKSMNI